MKEAMDMQVRGTGKECAMELLKSWTREWTKVKFWGQKNHQEHSISAHWVRMSWSYSATGIIWNWVLQWNSAWQWTKCSGRRKQEWWSDCQRDAAGQWWKPGGWKPRNTKQANQHYNSFPQLQQTKGGSLRTAGYSKTGESQLHAGTGATKNKREDHNVQWLQGYCRERPQSGHHCQWRQGRYDWVYLNHIPPFSIFTTMQTASTSLFYEIWLGYLIIL